MDEYSKLIEYIAKKAGLYGCLQSSTLKISKDLCLSQQSVSRKLREMEKKRIIQRSATPKGIKIILEKPGRDFLQSLFSELGFIFHKKEEPITGTFVKGLGEGAYYVDIPKYQNQFEKKLGFRAFPGTFNVRISKGELLKLAGKQMISIGGFETKQRSFGPLKCYMAKIKGITAAITIPERTTHGEDILELISPANLKQSLKVKEGDKVEVVVL